MPDSPLGRARQAPLARTCAYAVDVAQHRPAAPVVSFAGLARPAAALARPERLTTRPAPDLQEMVAAVSSLPDLDAASLDEDGVQALAQQLSALLAGTAWAAPDVAADVVTRTVAWVLRLWAVQEVAGVREVRAVTEAVIPTWSTTTVRGYGSGIGLGAALTELAERRRGRSSGTTIAASLTATRACRVWLTDGDAVVARHDRALHAPAGAVVYDVLSLADVTRVEPVTPRFTALRQLRTVFADGSKARWLYSSKRDVRDVLLSAVARPAP